MFTDDYVGPLSALYSGIVKQFLTWTVSLHVGIANFQSRIKTIYCYNTQSLCINIASYEVMSPWYGIESSVTIGKWRDMMYLYDGSLPRIDCYPAAPSCRHWGRPWFWCNSFWPFNKSYFWNEESVAVQLTNVSDNFIICFAILLSIKLNKLIK